MENLIFKQLPSNKRVSGPENWSIMFKSTNTVLGYIQWWGGFNKYMFVPSANRALNLENLTSIANFIDQITKERNKKIDNLKLALEASSENNIVIGMDICAVPGAEHDAIVVCKMHKDGTMEVLDSKTLSSSIPLPEREKAFNDMIDELAAKYNPTSYRKDGSFKKISNFEKNFKKSL